MPRRNELKTPSRATERAAKRLLAGERAETLAKELKVSRATIFNYAVRYRKAVLERERRAGLRPAEVDRLDKLDLLVTIKALQAENRMLKERLVAIALGTGSPLSPAERAIVGGKPLASETSKRSNRRR